MVLLVGSFFYFALTVIFVCYLDCWLLLTVGCLILVVCLDLSLFWIVVWWVFGVWCCLYLVCLIVC